MGARPLILVTNKTFCRERLQLAISFHFLKKNMKRFEQNQSSKFNKHVRAVPGGYYTGLINDMHKDSQNFQEKGTFLQMEYLKPLIEEIKQTTPPAFEPILNESKSVKLQAPITLSSLSIQCTLPFDYRQLEDLSPLAFLSKYAKPSVYREQVVRKLIRKVQRDTNIEFDDAKEIVLEYFNHYKTPEEISQLFHFLNIQTEQLFQSPEIIILCCYAERYFLHQLAKTERILFPRPLQEIVDLEFLKRKFDQVHLSEDLQRLIQTLEAPQEREF